MSVTVEEKDGSRVDCLLRFCGSPDDPVRGVGSVIEGDRSPILLDEGVAVKDSETCRPSIR